MGGPDAENAVFVVAGRRGAELAAPERGWEGALRAVKGGDDERLVEQPTADPCEQLGKPIATGHGRAP